MHIIVANDIDPNRNSSEFRGGSRVLGQGRSDKYIHKLGEGTGGGMPPPVI